MEKIGVLFVCMGNICRSPTAEGVFTHRLTEHGLGDRILVDSAGTHGYHIGGPPDPRACAAAERRGVDISGQSARRLDVDDFDRFHYVLAMDHENVARIEAICPPHRRDRVQLFLEYAPDLGINEVPDPYYGGTVGFERVLDMIESASAGLLEHIRKTHLRG